MTGHFERLAYTHLSSVSRLADRPENYSQFLFMMKPVDGGTELHLRITQFPTEVIYHHLRFYWLGSMEKIRQFAEQSG